MKLEYNSIFFSFYGQKNFKLNFLLFMNINKKIIIKVYFSINSIY